MWSLHEQQRQQLDKRAATAARLVHEYKSNRVPLSIRPSRGTCGKRFTKEKMWHVSSLRHVSHAVHAGKQRGVIIYDCLTRLKVVVWAFVHSVAKKKREKRKKGLYSPLSHLTRIRFSLAWRPEERTPKLDVQKLYIITLLQKQTVLGR